MMSEVSAYAWDLRGRLRAFLEQDAVDYPPTDPADLSALQIAAMVILHAEAMVAEAEDGAPPERARESGARTGRDMSARDRPLRYEPGVFRLWWHLVAAFLLGLVISVPWFLGVFRILAWVRS